MASMRSCTFDRYFLHDSFLLRGTLTCITLAIFASDAIERRIADNTKAALPKGKTRRRRNRLLNLPRSWLIQGTHFWGFATLLFGVQIAVQDVYALKAELRAKRQESKWMGIICG